MEAQKGWLNPTKRIQSRVEAAPGYKDTAIKLISVLRQHRYATRKTWSSFVDTDSGEILPLLCRKEALVLTATSGK